MSLALLLLGMLLGTLLQELQLQLLVG